MASEAKFMKLLENQKFESDSDDESMTENEEKDFLSSDEEWTKDSISKQQNSSKRLKTLRKGKLERQPTRRPNPNTFNRNALMARENRRKKKEYVEKLEQEIEMQKVENKTLKRALKKQQKIIQKLDNEKSYFRSILANKTEILALIKSLRGAPLPITTSDMSLYTPDTDSVGCSSASPRSMTESYKATDRPDDYELERFPFDSTCFDDFLPKPTDDFLDDPFELELIPDLQKDSVNDDHNYSNSNMTGHKTIKGKQPGVCLHVSGGFVSLEFCPTCHENARNAWLEEM